MLGLACLQHAVGEEEVVERLKIVEFEGDVHIDQKVNYRDTHLKIRGDLYLDKGAELILENCIVELMCTYSREFIYRWRGG